MNRVFAILLFSTVIAACAKSEKVSSLPPASQSWPGTPIAGPTSSVAPSDHAEVGRFVIVHSAEVERDTILLDTATGRTWSRVEVGDLTGEPPAWDPMPQLNTPDDYRALAAVHAPKAIGQSKADIAPADSQNSN